jgi:hypothetical protein
MKLPEIAQCNLHYTNHTFSNIGSYYVGPGHKIALLITKQLAEPDHVFAKLVVKLIANPALPPSYIWCSQLNTFGVEGLVRPSQAKNHKPYPTGSTFRCFTLPVTSWHLKMTVSHTSSSSDES